MEMLIKLQDFAWKFRFRPGGTISSQDIFGEPFHGAYEHFHSDDTIRGRIAV